MVTQEEKESLKLPQVPFPNTFWIHLWEHVSYPVIISSWSIYQENTTDSIHVYHREWRSPLATSSNKVEVKASKFIPDQAQFSQLLEQGKNIQIPIIGIENGRGKDGILFGIVFEAASAKYSDINWWGHGPKEWRELTTWHQKMVEFLRHSSKQA